MILAVITSRRLQFWGSPKAKCVDESIRSFLQQAKAGFFSPWKEVTVGCLALSHGLFSPWEVIKNIH
jgi:hypothetical protein